MHVQVLKRYRDRDTKVIHEAGELVEYESIPRIVVLARGGYVEPLEPLPADAEAEPAANTLPVTVNTEDLKITTDHLKKDPTDSEHVVTTADLEANSDMVDAGIKEGDTVTLGPNGALTPPVVTAGFSQEVDLKPESAALMEGNFTTGTATGVVVAEPSAAKKTGKATKGASKKPNKDK